MPDEVDKKQIFLMGRPHVKNPNLGDGEMPISQDPHSMELLSLLILSREFIKERGVKEGDEVTRDWLATMLLLDPKRKKFTKAVKEHIRYRLGLLHTALNDCPETVENQKQAGPKQREQIVARLNLDHLDVDVLQLRDAVRRGRHETVLKLAEKPLLEGMEYPWLKDPRILNVRAELDSYYLQALLHEADGFLAQMKVANEQSKWEDGKRFRNQALPLLDQCARRLKNCPDELDDHPLLVKHRNELERLLTKADYPAPLEGSPGNLLKPSPIFGRETELAEIKRRLLDRSLVTVTGTAGIGKTQLARTAAWELREKYIGGAWFVDLASCNDEDNKEEQILQAVAMSIGIKEEPGQPLTQTLAAYLNSRKTQTLLVLDNCEQLASSCAELVERVLSSSENVRILATSRRPLYLTAWEQLVEVLPLLYPSLADIGPDPAHRSTEWSDLDAVIVKYAAIRLFVERAQALGSHFVLTQDNLEAVVQICSHLDGIPLAIELAAGAIRMLFPNQIVERLNNRFELLRIKNRHIPLRRRSMQAALDLSYDLLSEPERLLLARLSVFAGGWQLEAAQEVCSGSTIRSSEVLELLLTLVGQSLIQVTHHVNEEKRCRLLETIQEYAANKLTESGESKPLRTSHLNYFMKLAEKHRDINHGENRTFLDQEWSNIVVAAERAADDLDWERASRLTNALGSFLMMRGQWSLREQMNRRVLKVLEQVSDPHTQERHNGVQAVAWNALGVVARVRAQWAESEECFRQSMAAWDRCHNRGDRWKTLINRGILYRGQHRLKDAGTNFTDAITDMNNAIDVDTKGCAHVNLGVVLQMQGCYAEAEQHLDKGWEMISSMGHQIGMAQTMNNRGILNRARWRLKEAENDFLKSLELRGPNGGNSGLAQAQSNLAPVLQMLGQLDESEQVTVAALEVRRTMDNQEGTAASLTNLALLYEMLERRDDAERFLNEALAICRSVKIGEAKVLHNRGVVRYEHGSHQAAVDDFNQSLELCRSYDDIEGIGRARLNLANAARANGNSTEAEQLEREAFEVYPMMKEQQANFAAEWEGDPSIGDRFRAIPYFTNRGTGEDLLNVVAGTLARFCWWDSHAALDAE